MAGVNAVMKIRGQEAVVLDRSQAYIGVLIEMCIRDSFLPGSVRWSGEEWPSYPCTGT